ncbi:MAG: alpha/beta fold hydrolase [Leptospiraceae bacterium]|nr:alpha/beta fold hydrolase [Leptospiraceae bacterium]MCP5503259.1 alpha/beta fold hydrolase [Leptospiraceae bacterium]
MKKWKWIVFIVLFLILLFPLFSGIYLASLVTRPPWYHPGLGKECSSEQIQSAPKLCISNPELALEIPFEPIRIPYRDSFLRGWFFPKEKGSEHLFLFVHGAGGDRRNGYKYVSTFLKAGYSVLLYDSPNHGESYNDGKGISYGFKEKEGFLKVLSFAEKKAKNIYVFASSAGTSAVLLSHKDWKGRVKALVLENPFFSLKRLIEENPTAKKLPYFLLRLSYFWMQVYNEFEPGMIQPGENLKDFPEIPVLVSHGTEDKTIPFQHGLDIFQALPIKEKTFYKAEGAGHCRIWNHQKKAYAEQISKTFTRALYE